LPLQEKTARLESRAPSNESRQRPGQHLGDVYRLSVGAVGDLVAA
jgi:hypothetical protein